jgi:uncharacterized membrane protein YqjE
MTSAHNSGSVWDSFHHKATSLLEMAQTRLELLSNEVEVARITITRQLILALALLFCVSMGLVLSTIGLVILFWEQRLLVAGIAAALAWGGAAYIYLRMRSTARHAAPLFNASMAELQEDLRQLKAAAGHGRTPG